MMRKLLSILILLIILRIFPANGYMSGFADSLRISDIKFYGIYPFFSTELLDRMSIYPGSVLDQDKIGLQKGYLEEYLKSKGYDSVKVDVDEEKVSDKLSIIKYTINKSSYMTIGEIKIKGNEFYSDIRLKKEMRTWWRSWLAGESGRIVPDELNNDLKTLAEFYRNNYFADVEINTEIITDSLKWNSDIVITIKEGPRYKIRITGNDFFSTGSLSEQTDMIKKGRRGSVSVRQIVRAVRQRYKEEGFGDVKIAWKDTLINEGEISENIVSMSINEGKRPLVTGISIEGNRSFGNNELSSYLNSVVRRWWRSKEYFQKDLWEDDPRNIKAFYNQNGFLSAKVKTNLNYSRTRDSISISVSIDEGIRTLIGDVKFEGTKDAIAEDFTGISGELSGKPYNSGMIAEKTAYIKGLLASKGYIYAQVKDRTSFSPDSTTADIKFTIDQKNIANTGSIFVTGNLKTKESTVKKLLTLKEGEPFSILSLSGGLRNLRNQKIFRSVSSFTPDMDTQKDTLDILVSVEEYPPYYFQASGGYESFTGPYISLLAGNKNLFGRNKELSLKTEASFIEQKVTAAFTEPVLFSPNLSGTLSAYWSREDNKDLDYESRTTGLTAGVNIRWESRLQSIIQANVVHKQLFEKNVAGTDSNTVKNSGSIKMIQIWDGRDSFMVPRRGIYANLETEFSSGIDNNEDDFIRYKLDLKYFFTPYGPVTFAFNGKLNFLQMTNPSAEPSVDQLFYLGGSSTVRGISDNSYLEDDAGDPAGGKLSALLTFEPRFEFRKNWELPLFLDTGLLSETTVAKGETVRSTAGTGLRYITPIGAMGILWGFPLDVKDGWKDGVFHFSIGYTF